MRLALLEDIFFHHFAITYGASPRELENKPDGRLGGRLGVNQ